MSASRGRPRLAAWRYTVARHRLAINVFEYWRQLRLANATGDILRPLATACGIPCTGIGQIHFEQKRPICDEAAKMGFPRDLLTKVLWDLHLGGIALRYGDNGLTETPSMCPNCSHCRQVSPLLAYPKLRHLKARPVGTPMQPGEQAI
jgi:hypothetical protein